MKIVVNAFALRLFIAAIFFFTPVLAAAQSGCPVLDRGHPPQYLTFDRLEHLSTVPKGDDPDRVWLRFHNNTSCPIVLISEMEPADRQGRIIKQPNGGIRFQRVVEPPAVPTSGTPIELAYQIQDNRMRQASMNATSKHYVFSVELLPERFIVFHVPSKYFWKRMHIVVPFNYQWELDKNGFMIGGFHVFHEVKFFNDELPKRVLQSKR